MPKRNQTKASRIKWWWGFGLLLLSLLVPSPAYLDETQYIYDSFGRLAGEIDSSGNLAIYTYDAVGNLLSITNSAAGEVAIITFSPSKGPVGTVITIDGIGFSSIPIENQVTFGGGLIGEVTSSTPIMIEATVPIGALTGPITVTTPLGSATSNKPFKVFPTMTSITPTFEFQGQTIDSFTITGRNLEDATEVSFSPPELVVKHHRSRKL